MRSAAARRWARWLRWGLGILLNPVFPTLPLGTLAANLSGGLMMGCAMELLTRHAVMSPEVRLLVTTGFLGGLTTFSTFSAEIVTLLMRRELAWGAIAIAVHVAGSIVMTIARHPARTCAVRLGNGMNGTLLRFYVHENRKHGHIALFEWLLEQAKAMGIHGGSAFRAIAGFGRHGILHEEHFFELAADMTVAGRVPGDRCRGRRPCSSSCDVSASACSTRVSPPNSARSKAIASAHGDDAEIFALAALWLGLALAATLLSIWLRIATAMSEIVVGTVAQLAIGALVGAAALGTDQSWIRFLASTGAVLLTFLAGAELDPGASIAA